MQRIKKTGHSNRVGEKPKDGSSNADKQRIYLAYPRALRRLQERLNATPEELAIWIFMGPEEGGIAGYRDVNELDPAPRFYFGDFMGEEDYLAPMMACWFLASDIESFNPKDHYITGKELIERWSSQAGLQVEAFIQAKIKESRLIDVHPTFGGTRGTDTDDDDDTVPPLEAGLFVLAHVEAVEMEDLGCSVERREQQPSVGSPEWRKKNAQAAADARHDMPGGSREKRDAIRAIWASGKYTSRDLCAEQECAALDMSFSSARNALKNQPKLNKKNLSSA